VAHNLPFDSKFLVAQLDAAAIPAPEIRRGVCTLSIAKRYIPGLAHKLADCCDYAKIELRDAHKALGDATATARLLSYFLGAGVVPAGAAVRRRAFIPEPRTPIGQSFVPR
jgi:DNA polymerase III subunit epsilon